MLHQISERGLGAQGPAMTRAISNCVHCGFCLAACPTYELLGEEMDSPRGRIVLMKEALEGNLSAADVGPYLEPCLGCLACETACPSGVVYRELLHPYRDRARRMERQPILRRLSRRLLHATLPHPRRFRCIMALGRVLAPLGGFLPAKLRLPLELLKIPRPRSQPPLLPGRYPSERKRRARVALLTGCVQQVLRPQINWATLQVLAHNGVDVLVPRDQGCCGSLALHEGEWEWARRLARRNLDSMPSDVDAIVTNAAGCGSGMKEYPLLFAGTPEEDPARELADKVEDVSSFLLRLGWEPPGPLPSPLRVTYQDACHLAHAQGIRSAPRRLLESIPNATLLAADQADVCCGSAGTYNVDQPQLAWELGRRKVDHLLDTRPDAVTTGNIGCLIQLTIHLRARGQTIPVLHTVELLARAYGTDAQSKMNRPQTP